MTATTRTGSLVTTVPGARGARGKKEGRKKPEPGKEKEENLRRMTATDLNECAVYGHEKEFSTFSIYFCKIKLVLYFSN